jgi:hypothetical protein
MIAMLLAVADSGSIMVSNKKQNCFKSEMHWQVPASPRHRGNQIPGWTIDRNKPSDILEDVNFRLFI